MGTLVIGRSAGRRVMLTHPETGLAVVVEVVDVGHGKVRLAFRAPRSVLITRDELLSTAACRDIEEMAQRKETTP